MRNMLSELMGSQDTEGAGGEPSKSFWLGSSFSLKLNRLDQVQRCRRVSHVPAEVLPAWDSCVNGWLIKKIIKKLFNKKRGDIGECRLNHNLSYRCDYERARAKDPRLFFEFDVSNSTSP